MKKTAIFSLIAFVIVAFAFAGRDYAEAASPVSEGYVASLDLLVKGGDGKVDKDVAKSKLQDGSPLVFVSGGKAYIVLSEGGTYDGLNLSKYAVFSAIGVKGSKSSKGGVSYIIAESINSME